MFVLQHIIATLHQSQRDLATPYYVPGLWADHETAAALPVNPYQFYADKLMGILTAPQVPLFGGNGGGAWTRQAIIYNLFPRVTTAYDHAH
ncbi:MAG: hypothetical protein K8S97_05280, partial [Anaerolineae bacterium]|nr:hypothetical protein [Anaerolineae bacterium]